MTDETLSQLIKRRMRELGLTYAEMERRGQGGFSRSTAHGLVVGSQRGARPETLAAIAKVLQVPESAMWQAYVATRSVEPFVLPKRANTLSPTSRAAVLQMIDALLIAQEAGHGQPR